MLEGVVFSTLRTFFHRLRRHRALQPDAIERVIGIGSKSVFIHFAANSPKPEVFDKRIYTKLRINLAGRVQGASHAALDTGRTFTKVGVIFLNLSRARGMSELTLCNKE